MEELRLSHAWPPLARFCAAAAFFVGVSVMMIGCGGGGGSPIVSVQDDGDDNGDQGDGGDNGDQGNGGDNGDQGNGGDNGDSLPPIAFGQVNDIAALPIVESGDVYTLNVQSQSLRTVSIAVEGGGGSFAVTQSMLTLTAGENSFQLRATAAINDIFATDNFVVTMTFGLRDIFDDSATLRFTIRFASRAARDEHGRKGYLDLLAALS